MAKTKKTAKTVKKSTVKAKSKAKKATPAKAKKASKKPVAKKKAVKSATKKPVAKKTAPKKVAPKKAAPKKVEAKPVAKKVAPKKSSSAPKAHERPAIPNLNFFPPLTQRPIAHKQADKGTVTDDKTRYSDGELKEFETLILEKLEKARSEYKILKETLNRNNDEGTDATSGGNTKVLEDGAETAEKENLSQLAARQQKYITNLENALVRIKNGTYGICSVTGKLIPKERLIAVPHTTQSIEAKMMKKD
jgi:RNA polymerase-binding transcription factor DksA